MSPWRSSPKNSCSGFALAATLACATLTLGGCAHLFESTDEADSKPVVESGDLYNARDTDSEADKEVFGAQPTQEPVAIAVPGSPAEEAQVLWTDGRESFEAGRWLDAVNLLSRLIKRYPATTGFTEAHLLVGLAEIERGRAKFAIQPIQFYIVANDLNAEGARARLKLALAYWLVRRFDEVILVSDEVITRADRLNLSDDLRAEALLWKAQGQLGLKRDTTAAITRDSALHLVTKIPRLTAQNAWLDLQLRHVVCARLPSTGRMTEDQARDQIERKADCLNQSTVAFRDVISSDAALGETRFSDAAYASMERGYASLKLACENPPPPTGKRTARELKRYKMELKQLLAGVCPPKRAQVVDILESYKEKLPKVAVPYITRLVSAIH